MRSVLIWACEIPPSPQKGRANAATRMNVTMDDMQCSFFMLNCQFSTVNCQLPPVGLALVVCGELAFCHGDELGLDHLLTERRKMVHEHLAVKVVVFVLEDACLKSFEPTFLLFAIFVEVVDEHFGRTLHALVDAGDGEASLRHGYGFFTLLDDFGVDEGVVIVFVLRLVVGDDIEVNDEEPDGQTYLRCSKPDTFGMFEGFEYVGDELFEIGIGIEVYLLGSLAKHWLTEYVPGKNHIYLQFNNLQCTIYLVIFNLSFAHRVALCSQRTFTFL